MKIKDWSKRYLKSLISTFGKCIKVTRYVISVSLFIDGGVGLVSPICFILARPSIEQRKQFYNCEANNFSVA